MKMMCVIAHPDDECFAFGGALALAADRGVETYVVCLTDGQAGSYRGDAASGAELGQMRREEFVASCEVLGVKHHELLDYQDGRLEFADFSRTAGRLVERMRRFKPDVVITFGSDGGLNTHADHMMVSSVTTAAFHWAGREKRYPELATVFQPKRLFYVSTNFFLPERQAPLPMPWTVTLDIKSVKERKAEAFRAHTSQAPLMERTREIFEVYGGEEFYSLVATAEPQPARLSVDLFEGLEG
ncbi:LmbE family N-acetylglucosaminyl deacetylase [Granulicella arctica]|uniref:LmbE family N-acetylglucosaminyl deacetylase n=2 Tax=Granulicella arctica TaxID=940613 RepID=A0A7Y9PIM6_9BACT|nr:LmbE family N-acetylglucosaminyl deacetylase [Granulicella arctica]